MKPPFLFKQLWLLVVGWAVLNVLIWFASRHSVSHQLIHAIQTSPPVTTLFVGNSLMADGADVAAFQGTAAPGSHGLNISLGGSGVVEHDLLLRRALTLTPQRVYYGFFDTQLTDPPKAGFTDLCGNRTLVHYLDRETAIRLLAPHDWLTAWRIRLVSCLPVVVERMTLWTKVEILRRRIGGFGLPAQATNHFGRAGDFTLLEASNAREFARLCGELAARRTGFSEPVSDMIVSAQRQHAEICLVEMPIPSAHRDRFYSTPQWTAYETALRAQAAKSGVTFVQAADWIDDTGFKDPLHLNPQGAAAFSRRLATCRPANEPAF